MKSSRVRKAWHARTRLARRDSVSGRQVPNSRSTAKTNSSEHSEPKADFVMKNLFSYQSCTKKGSKVFTTQCWLRASLNFTLPSPQTPRKHQSKEGLRSAMQQCHRGKERQKKTQVPKKVMQPPGYLAGKGRPWPSAVCSSQDKKKSVKMQCLNAACWEEV